MHCLVALATAQIVAAGQSILPDPKTVPQHLAVSTRTSAPAVAPGSKVSLVVEVTPNPGIYVYAPGAKDLVPIAVKLNRRAGVSFGETVYPKAETRANEPAPVFQKPFRLVREATVDRTAKAGTTMTVTGVVNYQACDGTICFKPAVVPVEWTFAVR